jgi:hypothetical protein
MNAFPFLLGALCVMAIAYRYYGAFIAAKIIALDDSRATPAHRLNDGSNYHPTNKWVLFGHHHAVYDLWGEHLSDPARGGDIKPAFYTGRETPAQKAAAAARFVAGDTPVLVMANRAGFGLDGLQKVCRTVVIGELDWAPAVHEQGIARAARDGQEHPVQAWYLVSGAGSDPVLAEVLGLKRAQAEPLRDPDVPLSEDLAVDANYVARLAEAFLGRKAAGAGSGVETA